MTTIAVPRRRILRPRLPTLAAIKRLGDPSFNRLGIRGQPWGLGRAGAAAAWLPSDLDNLILWLRASSITGLNDGDPITTWDDESGQGNDVTQPVAANRPTYETNEINGLPTVRFDGLNDLLVVTLAAEIAVPNTILLVAKHVTGAVAANDYYVGCRDTGNAIATTLFADSTGADVLAFYSGVNRRTIALDTAYHYSGWVVNGVTSIVRVDGVDWSADTGLLGIRGIGIGASSDNTFAGNVEITEVVITSDGLTTDELDLFDTYAAAVYGL